MNPKKIWANLAVSNLERTTNFYRALGFQQNGTPTAELTSFIIGQDSFIVHFFIEHKLRTAIKGTLVDPANGNEIIFTLWAENRDEVDSWAKEITGAGGTLVSQPEAFGQGYYGFVFADPDGHRFNVFHM